MLNYDSLIDISFEALCRDVMERILEVPLRRFLPGKDGGVYLTNDVTTKNIVVLIKNDRSHTTSQLLRSLKEELPNVKTLAPQQFYICCSRELSSGNIKELYHIFQDYMESDRQINTLIEIDDFLQKEANKDILNKYPKLLQKGINAVLDSVHRVLKDYADEVRSNVSSGRTDILIDAESVFCGVFNMVYDYKLVRPTEYRRNYPAVDLIDQDKRVAVQITSTNTRQKVRRTADSFLRYGFMEKYDTLIVFILVYAPSFRGAEQLTHQLGSDGVNLKIMTLLDLVKEIESQPHERIQQIADYLEQKIGFGASEPSPIEEINHVSSVLSMNIDQLPEICRQVFHLAMLLPEEGLARTVFEHGLCLDEKHALVDLIKQGILQEEDTNIRMHPNYQPSKDETPTLAESKFFLEKLWNYEESWQWDKIVWRRKSQVRASLAQIFSRAADIFSDVSAVYAERSAELWRSTLNYADALTREQTALAAYESVEKESWDVARALHFTGDCYIKLEKPDLALKDWKRTLELCIDPLHASAPDLATAYLNVGNALLDLKEYSAAKRYLLKSLRIMEELRRSGIDFLSPPWMEAIYHSLSDLYTALGNVHDASLCSKNEILPPSAQQNLWEILIPLNLPLISSLTEDAFVGRSEQLARIAEEFQIKKVVYLVGYGGIGKTELANQFGKRYTEGTAYFVRFRESISETIVHGIAVGIDVFSEKDSEEAYRETIERLARCGENDLLIIDEVNVSPEMMQKDPGWQDLMQLPLKILITTRYGIPGAIQVGSLERESLYQLFEKQKLKMDHETMDSLIDEVYGQTLAVDLIARILKLKPDFSAEKVLNALKANKSSFELFQHVPSESFEDNEERRIYYQLCTLFMISHLGDTEMELLRNMTLLPENGIAIEVLDNILSLNNQEALGSLINRGFLDFDKDSRLVKIHPIIRQICREGLKPDDGQCRDFLDALWRLYNPKQYDADMFRQFAELFSQAADNLQDREGIWAFRASVFWSLLGNTEEVLRCETLAANRQEESAPNSEDLATTYSNLGLTYGELGNHKKALEYQFKALEIRKTILPPEHPALANSYNNIGKSYGDLGENQKSLEYIQKALSIAKQVFPPNHPDLALSYYNIGMTYSALCSYQEALEYQQKALEIRQRILPLDHPDLADSYHNVGVTLGNLRNYGEALDCQRKALGIWKNALTPDHLALATAYNDIAWIYGELGKYREALDYQKKALDIQRKNLPADHPELIGTFNHLGRIYNQLGEYGQALEYIMMAMNIGEKILPPNHLDLAASYRNLANTYSSLGDHRKALDYSLKALEIYEIVFSPNHLNTATAYADIGFIYGDLGDYSKALAYLKRAFSIFEAVLPEGDPTIEDTIEGIEKYMWMQRIIEDGERLSNPNPASYSFDSSD